LNKINVAESRRISPDPFGPIIAVNGWIGPIIVSSLNDLKLKITTVFKEIGIVKAKRLPNTNTPARPVSK